MKYPNGKKNIQTSNKTNTSNRGMSLEQDIVQTNLYYLAEKIACIHKKPTPIQIVKVDYPKRSAAKIVEAYFKLPSTTDFNGIYKGKYIDFEAKETNNSTRFPFSSIHKHQIEHLERVLNLGGIAFLIIRFNNKNITFLINASDFIYYYKNTDKSSVPYQWFCDNGYSISYNYIKPVDYLKVVDQILEEKNEK